MNDIFISKIQINEVRNIRNFEIPIAENELKHLIITGKNGSGKTSLLLELKKILPSVKDRSYFKIGDYKKILSEIQLKLIDLENEEKTLKVLDAIRSEKSREAMYEGNLEKFKNVDLIFSNLENLVAKTDSKQILIKAFDAKRNAQPKKPTGITKVTLREDYSIDENANTDFIQYIVNLKADRSFARDEGKQEEVQAIDKWFVRFETRLQELFGAPSLKLEFDRQNYNFKLVEKDKAPYDLNTLSDGYSAVMSIVTELILRMEGQNVKLYDVEGIVLIDEIETHLHVELQKKILPFLTDFFPKIQFIVTTHSPFVMNSISNAVVCDLEKRIVTEDLSSYSYEAVIESYFETDMYSEEVKKKVARFEALSNQERVNDNEATELSKLETYFDAVPKFLSKELQIKIQQIQLHLLTKTLV